MANKILRNERRVKRHLGIRSKIKGTNERPRLCVFKSNKFIYAQFIDDDKGVTLAQASTRDKKLGLDEDSNKKNIEAAEKLGEALAELASKLNIKNIVFDRSGYVYHGRLKALCDVLRQKGLVFLILMGLGLL